jgi:hypothetical protein
LEKIVSIFFTFSDFVVPEGIKALNKSGIQFNNYYLIENSALFSEKDTNIFEFW